MLWIISSIESEEDRTFVEKIYIKYEKRMYVISYSILNDHHDSEDCVHETVKIIIDSLDKFKSAYSNNALDTLIILACRNCAINMAKKRNKRIKNEVLFSQDGINDDFYIDKIPDFNSEVDKQFISNQNVQDLKRLINELEPIYQDVITLRIMDLSYEEIGGILSISSQAARLRMYRARKKLKELGGGLADEYRR